MTKNEKVVDASKIFGEGVEVATDKGITTESLEDYYRKTFEEDEDFFDEDFEKQEKQFKDEPEEDDFFDEDFDEFEEEQKQILGNKKEFLEEISEVTQEELEAELELDSLASQKIKDICSSPIYPSDFPSYEEILKLKAKYKNLVFVFSGNLIEEFQFSVIPKLFICRTFQSKDYLEFTNMYPDSNQLMLYPFVVANCTLFPKIDMDNIMELNAGILKKIGDNVLINSDYKTSLEVIVL